MKASIWSPGNEAKDASSYLVVNVLDYGAVADSDFDCTKLDNPSQQATDNTEAFQAAIDAAWGAVKTNYSEDYGGVVYIPSGGYRLDNPVYVHPSIKILGAGMYATKIFTPNDFSGRGVLVTDAQNSPYSNVPGFPTTVKSMAILAASGGSVNGTGIYLNKNGCFVDDVWVAGFGNGIVINNTDCFITNFAVELNTYGIVGLQPTCTISDGVVFDNGTGIYIQNVIRMQAVAGSSNTITFPAIAVDPTGAVVTQNNDAFNGWLITIVSGTGAGQSRKISDYVGASRTATVASNWSTAPDSTSVFTLDVDAGSVAISNVRVSPSAAAGINIYRSKRVQVSNCSAIGNDSKFAEGALKIEEAVDVNVTNFRTQCGVYSGDASTTKDGIRVINSSVVTLTSATAAFWRNGISVINSQNVTINGNQSTSNTLRGLLIEGGDQIIVNGGTYSNNGTASSTTACGIESNNSASSAIHSILGAVCSGNGGVQDYGIIATLSGSGRTIISGGTTAAYNTTSEYLLTDTAGNGLIFTSGSFPTTRTVPTISSASNPLVIPPWAADGGFVLISGNNTIANMLVAGYAGASVTLGFTGYAALVSNTTIRLVNPFNGSPQFTLSLVCDGTKWYETSRASV